MTCVSDDVAAELLAGHVPRERETEIQDHLDRCAPCRWFVGELARTMSQPTAADAVSERAVIGRYQIIRRIGDGGMGVVYAAHDPKLERDVAIKLVRSDRTDDSARARLVREAQAIARIQHPNVIGVFDVGEDDGEIYLAMELVDGTTLGRHLREHAPTWRATLGLLLEAGEGLACAHRHGIVHRDFKPDNVMVSADARVRVLDFGLARATRAVAVNTDAAAAPLHSSFAGTPAYMSPEQTRGEPVDAASDQYSFCVVVYEALFGLRPREQLAGPITFPVTPVPRAIQRALRRGLAIAPADRFESMAALLRALRLRPRRNVAIAAVGGLLAIAGVVTALGAARDPAVAVVACDTGSAPIDTVWSSHAADALAAVFARGPAAASWPATQRNLDDYAAAWTRSRTAACEATRLGIQSADLLDRRMICLDRRLHALRTVIASLSSSEPHRLELAAGAVEQLPPVAACDDFAALTARSALPADPTVRQQILAAERDLTAAESFATLGNYDATALAKIAVTGEQLGYLPLEAEALYYEALAIGIGRGFEQPEVASLLFRAAGRAQAGGVDEYAAKAFLSLASTKSQRRSLDESEQFLQLARGAVERLGSPPVLVANVDTQRAAIAFARGDFRAAVDAIRASLAVMERETGRDSLETLEVANHLAETLPRVGAYEEAAAVAERVLAARIRRLGASHKSVAEAHKTAGTVAASRGDTKLARDHFEAALAIYVRTRAPDYTELVATRMNLARMLIDLGSYADAEAQLALVEPTLEGRTDNDAVRKRAVIATHRGRAALQQGRFEQAEAHYRLARTLHEQVGGPKHPVLIGIDQGIAGALHKRGRLREASVVYARALALAAEINAPPTRESAVLRLDAGLNEQALGRTAAALALLDQSKTMFEHLSDHEHFEQARAAVARARSIR